jgi:hypothetical protein
MFFNALQVYGRKLISHACDFSLIDRSASSSFSNPEIVSTSPPLIIIRMHPLIGRDLALLRQLDHMNAFEPKWRERIGLKSLESSFVPEGDDADHQLCCSMWQGETPRG